MKRVLLMAAVAVMVIAMGTTAFAVNSQTNDVTVSAKVLGVCYFNTASASIAFADIDPSTISPVTATTTLQYACTTHTVAPTITQDAGISACAGATAGGLGSDLYLKNGSDCMKYTLSAPALTATGFASFSNELVTATIGVSAFQSQPAGVYSDTVVLTVNY